MSAADDSSEGAAGAELWRLVPRLPRRSAQQVGGRATRDLDAGGDTDPLVRFEHNTPQCSMVISQADDCWRVICSLMA